MTDPRFAFGPQHTYEEVLYWGQDARTRMTAAAQLLAKAVGTTLGPHGRPAMLDRDGKAPTVTKDGVTVLYDLEFEDKVSQIVYEIMRSQGELISKHVGDGTTTVVYLTAALMTSLNQLLVANLDYKKVEEGVRLVGDFILNTVEDIAIPARDERVIKSVLTTASNNDSRVIDTLTEAFMEVGDDGMIFIRPSQSVNDRVIYEQGNDLPIKLDTPEILDPQTGRVELNNPYILVGINNISSAHRLVNIFEEVATKGETKDLVIIYSEMSEDAKILIHRNNNSKESPLRIAAFRMPMYAERQKEYLEDWAAITDATPVDHAFGVKYSYLGLKEMGSAEYCMLTQGLCRITGGRGGKTIQDNGKTRLQNRITDVEEFRDTFVGNQEERTRQNERVAKLLGNVVSVCPGGATRSEIMLRRGIYEDALMAGQSALKSGVVPGGGIVWYAACEEIKQLDSYKKLDPIVKAGADAAIQAFQVLFTKLCRDAGVMATRKFREIEEPYSSCFNTRTNTVGDFIDENVVEPVMLHEAVITQAISTALTLMSAELVITRESTPEYLAWKEQQRVDSLRA